MVDILLIRFLAVLFVDLSRRMLLPSSAGDHFYMVPFFSFLLLSDCRERRWNGGEGKGRNKAPARDVQKLLVQIRTKKAE